MAAEIPGTETTKPAATLRLDELSDAQFEQSMLTGELPPREAPAKGAEEQAVKDAEAAAATADKPASTDASSKTAPEAVDPGKSKKLPGQKKSATERAEELETQNTAAAERLQKALARRRELEDQIEAAERAPEPKPKRAETSREAAAPATDADKRKKYRELPDAPKPPKMDDFKGETALDDYMAAVHTHSADMAEFIAEKLAEDKFAALYETRSKADSEAAARDREFIERVERAETRMQADLKADPEIIDRIPDRWKRLNPSDRRGADEPMTAAHFVKDQVMFGSDHPLQLSEWLCENNYAELTRIAKLSPEGIIRAIALQDATFGPDDGLTDPEAGADERPHPRVSKAPAPTKTLPGKKAAAGVDPLKKAIDEGDFDTFNALESQRERAAAGG